MNEQHVSVTREQFMALIEAGIFNATSTEPNGPRTGILSELSIQAVRVVARQARQALAFKSVLRGGEPRTTICECPAQQAGMMTADKYDSGWMQFAIGYDQAVAALPEVAASLTYLASDPVILDIKPTRTAEQVSDGMMSDLQAARDGYNPNR